MNKTILLVSLVGAVSAVISYKIIEPILITIIKGQK